MNQFNKVGEKCLYLTGREGGREEGRKGGRKEHTLPYTNPKPILNIVEPTGNDA